jgi:gluconokinase
MLTAASHPFSDAVVVMGVASCGKTTLGEALAQKLDIVFVEGDTLHPRSNVEKMSAGQPLNDDDRWPWLQKVGEALRGQAGIIASCSALKKNYRLKIQEAAGRAVLFIHLDGTYDVLAKRIAKRQGHFMPASLLQSQIATLERPDASETFITIDVAALHQTQMDQAIKFLTSRKT